jgi:hypothetical protein
VAQTRKKRSTKHRGNAAGIVEARGRTGRKPTDDERKPANKTDERKRRIEDRRNQPPTWRGAINRAGIATLLFIVAVILLFKQDPGVAVTVGLVAFLFYVPLGYYVDLSIYKRHQRKKASA